MPPGWWRAFPGLDPGWLALDASVNQEPRRQLTKQRILQASDGLWIRPHRAFAMASADSSHPRHIVCYLPRFMTGIGGVEVLVLNLASAFSSLGVLNCRLMVVCPKDSFVHSELGGVESPSLTVRAWEDGLGAPPPDPLLVSWGGYGTLCSFSAWNPRVLFWSTFPGGPLDHLRRLPGPMRFVFAMLRRDVYLMHRIGRFLVQNDGICFMDGPNRLAMEKLCRVRMPERYLPIPVTTNENRYLKRTGGKLPHHQITLTWVGRGKVPWKAIPLARFLEDMVVPDVPVEIHLFTDDPTLYDDLFQQRGIDARYTVRYHLGVSGTALRDALATKSDLHLGMGTAVLEGAAEGIPSVCIDPQQRLQDKASWSYLHQRRDYDLGSYNGRPEGRRPLDLAALHARRDAAATLSTLTFDYVCSHHSVGRVAAQLQKATSRVTVRDYLDEHGPLLRLAFCAVCAHFRRGLTGARAITRP